MPTDIAPGIGLLAACISIRDIQRGAVESRVCSSVLEAVEFGIEALADRDDKTAVVVVGEDEGVLETEEVLAIRSAGLAGALEQAGLFITLAAQDIVRDRLANDVRFEDFGIIDSPEAGRAERVFAVLHPDLAEPALPHKKITGNCPRLHKSFVGRHRERDELQDLVLHRALVTITGAPGVGKSMMAIQVARTFDDEYDDGVWWFSVDDRTSLDELLQAIASTKGLLVLHGPLTIERVAEGLAQKRGIIIFDGCESMIAEIGAFCSAVFNKQRSLTLLLTSTKPLGITEEFVFRLDPMSLPRASDVGDDALIGSDALSLFFERATQAGVRLALDDKNIDLISRICERIDGLPAAIELVASSLRTSSLEMLAVELDWDGRDPKLHAKGLSGRLPMFEQVLQLKSRSLSEEERDMLARLGMFRGEWNIETAGFVWGDRFGDGDLFRLHQALVDGSWVSYNPGRNTFRMLHTIRSFCAGKGKNLGQSLVALTTQKAYPFAAVSLEDPSATSEWLDAASAIEQRYCARMAELSSTVFAELQGASTLDSEAILSRHYADFVHALELSFDREGLCARSGELMTYLVQFWLRRNLLDDASRLSLEYLERGAIGIEAARALTMLGVVHLRRREFKLATEEFNKSLELAKQVGNRLAVAAILSNLGMTSMGLGRHEQSIASYEESIALFRVLGQSQLLCAALTNAADVRIKYAGTLPAQSEYRRVLLENATRSLKETSGMSSNLDPMKLQALLCNLGSLALAEKDLAESESCFSKAVALCARHSMRHEAGEAIEGLAEISLLRGQGPTAAKLLGLARGIRREAGTMQTDHETQRLGNLITGVFRQVDGERVEKLMSYGERLDLAEILTPTIFNL